MDFSMVGSFFKYLADSPVASALGKALTTGAGTALVSAGVAAITGGDAKKAALYGFGAGAAGSLLYQGFGGGEESKVTNTAPPPVDSPSSAGASPPPAQQKEPGLLYKWNNLTSGQGEILGNAISGGVQGWFAKEAADEAAKQAEKDREFEREKMGNQNNQFFVKYSEGTDWNKYLENARAATRSV